MSVSQVKERIRGPRLEVLIKKKAGVPMEEALRSADAEGLTIAPNRRVAEAVTGGNIKWICIRESLPCWTGTMVGYDEPGKPLGESIGFTDERTGIRYVFPVPKDHVGEKNIALVAEHPDFTLEADKNDRIVHAAEVGIVPFPDYEGYFPADPRYGIPTGDRAKDDDPPRSYLCRLEKRVGLIARSRYHHNGEIEVNLRDAPSEESGVAVEFGVNPITVERRIGGFNIRAPPMMIERIVKSLGAGMTAMIDAEGIRLSPEESDVTRVMDAMLMANPLIVAKEGRSGLDIKGVPELAGFFARCLELVGKKMEEQEVLPWR